MSYIVFDLEFNQGFKPNEENNPLIDPKFPFEIIQIGAIKLDENFKILSTLNIYIKPILYTVIHPIVAKITGITMEELNKAKIFKDIYNELVDFIENDDILVVWGMADIKELFRNIKYHDLDSSLISKKYINLQRHTSKYFKCPKGTSIGLNSAVDLLNISSDNKFHDAFNDAHYTSEVFKKIYAKRTLKTQTYIINRRANTNDSEHKKHAIDTVALLKQFEKMFNRELTSEEQSMIKLAYIMGKTNQFTTKDSATKNSKGI